MSEIEFYGIKTNNLKSINVKIPKNKITLITGISGGGKSSLAYDTIYELCKSEFESLEQGFLDGKSYSLDRFKNIIPAVAIKQKNTNINPRSTLYSSLNFQNHIFELILGEKLPNDISNLKINSPVNSCNTCSGLGSTLKENFSKLIDFSLKIGENPFKIWWDSNKEKYTKLLISFCMENEINTEKNFNQLSEKEKKLLLYGKQNSIFEISFYQNGKRRKKKLPYIGLMDFVSVLKSSENTADKEKLKKYSDEVNCIDCSGSRLKKNISDIILFNRISLFEILTLPLSDLRQRLLENNKLTKYNLFKLINSLCELGLGYLSLTRSIPSLSGGELQKAKLASINSSRISGVLYIFDELSSQIDPTSFDFLSKSMLKIVENGNTLILVEHDHSFFSIADKIIEIGPKAGDKGGYLIAAKPCSYYERLISSQISLEKNKNLEFIEFNNINKNNVSSLNLNFAKNALNSIVGKSGSGKSSIAEYIYETNDNVLFISQELIKGNIRSTVSSIIGINRIISKIFSDHYEQDEDYFMPGNTSGLSCDTCHGLGVVRYQRSFDSPVDIECPSCNGRLFTSESKDYTLHGISLFDIYGLEFTDLVNHSFSKSNLNIKKVFENACKLGLGHLKLHRKTQSLSGGELRRLKLLKSISFSNRNSNKILIIDEPSSGLDYETSLSVIDFLREKSKSFLSIIIIDHKPSIYLNTDYLIQIGPGAGVFGGNVVYSGHPSDYFYSLKN